MTHQTQPKLQRLLLAYMKRCVNIEADCFFSHLPQILAIFPSTFSLQGSLCFFFQLQGQNQLKKVEERPEEMMWVNGTGNAWNFKRQILPLAVYLRGFQFLDQEEFFSSTRIVNGAESLKTNISFPLLLTHFQSQSSLQYTGSLQMQRMLPVVWHLPLWASSSFYTVISTWCLFSKRNSK